MLSVDLLENNNCEFILLKFQFDAVYTGVANLVAAHFSSRYWLFALFRIEFTLLFDNGRSRSRCIVKKVELTGKITAANVDD